MNTIYEFISVLASSAPTPGGGGAAALCGAIGTALGNMVGALTVGKKKYAEFEPELRAAMGECDRLQEELLSEIQKDADCFAPLAKAYAIPKDDPTRAQRLEEATLTACTAPLEIMELCTRAIQVMEVFAEKGSKLALSDAGCGAAICAGALRAADLNVRINTRALQDREKAKALDAKADAYLAYANIADEIYDKVRKTIGGTI